MRTPDSDGDSPVQPSQKRKGLSVEKVEREETETVRQRVLYKVGWGGEKIERVRLKSWGFVFFISGRCLNVDGKNTSKREMLDT